MSPASVQAPTPDPVGLDDPTDADVTGDVAPSLAWTWLLSLRTAPFVVLIGHVAAYGDWIVDDAAITFAYARNVAEGYGFVSMPGAPPVEGFSNLLWLLLLSGWMALGSFDPVWTPKLLGVLCAAGSFVLIRQSLLARAGARPSEVDLGLALLAATPGFVIWCASGLENPLYALLMAGLLSRSTSVSERATVGDACIAGLLGWMMSMTRPEGIVLAALWPLLALRSAPLSLRARWMRAGVAAVTTLLGFGAVIAWRWTTFGDVVPNTFHAKVGGGWTELPPAIGLALVLTLIYWAGSSGARRDLVWSRVLVVIAVVAAMTLLDGRSITRAIGGDLGLPVFATAFAIASVSNRPREPWILGAVLTLLAFECLPRDWMGEFRFGTPFLVVTIPWIVTEIGGGLRRIPHRRWALALRLLALAALLVTTARNFRAGLEYRRAPTVPMQDVQDRFRCFERWAAELVTEDPTVLIPDVGGALWSRSLRVHDLGGLCSRAIAPLLRSRRKELADFILEQLRPTFIEFHGSYTRSAGLHDDPRMRTDYVAIVEYEDPSAWSGEGPPIRSGVYVRREHAPTAEALARWGEEFR